MTKKFWVIVLLVAILLGGIFWASSSHNQNNIVTTSPTNHVEGGDSDHVTLVEYGDYQCPACEEYFSIVKQIAAEYQSEIHFQFRNFPLQSLHPNAFAAARAAEAAGLMGQFWQMHDLLYENNDPTEASGWIVSSNPLSYFDQFAKTLGLNINSFNNNYASDKVDSLINADISAGTKLGIDSTPTFYLDGKLINPTPLASSFEQYINSEIELKTAKS